MGVETGVPVGPSGWRGQGVDTRMERWSPGLAERSIRGVFRGSARGLGGQGGRYFRGGGTVGLVSDWFGLFLFLFLFLFFTARSSLGTVGLLMEALRR